ncbi:hypothetical protein FXO38_22816 [Capsicum annuum]|nr:hypothetical protein FXO38_22816 [Capsicum annuum]
MIAIEDPKAIQVVLVGNKVPRQECDNKWITERKKATRNQKKKVVIEMENITQNKFAELESQGDKQFHKGMETDKGERSHTKPQNEQIQDEWADNTSTEDEESINESSEDEDEILNYHYRGKDGEAEDVQKAVKEIYAIEKAYLQEKIENMLKEEEPGKNLLVGAQRVKENYHKRPLIFLLMIKILNWNIRGMKSQAATERLMVTCKISLTYIDTNAFVSVVYAKSKPAGREELWDHMRAFASMNSNPWMKLNKAKAELGIQHKIIDKFWRQKANLKWYMEGDENIKFFHSVVKGRRKLLNIHKIFVEDQWVEVDDNIGEPAAHSRIFLNKMIGRPISLSNVSQKIVCKVLNNRLSRVIPKIISQNQSGFIKDRSIGENVLLAPEIIHNIRTKGGNVLIKLDMNKAYDRLAWNFLCIVMRRMGFIEQWISIIWNLLSNMWYTVIVNGKRHGFFKSHKGRKRIQFFTDMVTRIIQRIGSWQNKLLSTGGRIILIKHVLTAIPMHLLSICQPPKTTLQKLKKRLQISFGDKWMEKINITGHPGKNCLPTNEGGIGVRSMQDIADVFAAKLWWQFRTRISLRTDFMKAKYSQRVHPVARKWNYCQSHTWRRMMKIRSKDDPRKFKANDPKLVEGKSSKPYSEACVAGAPKYYHLANMESEIPPREGWTKLNTDGCSKGNPGPSGGGGIIRNSQGKILGAFAVQLGHNTNNIAEATTLKIGLEICRDKGISHIDIESDSMLLVKWIQNSASIPWNVFSEIMEIRNMMNSFEDSIIWHCYREANKVADCLANFGVQGSGYPGNAKGEYNMDRLGFPSFRIKPGKNTLLFRYTTSKPLPFWSSLVLLYRLTGEYIV